MGKWTIEIRRYGGDETDPGFRRMHSTSEHDAYRIDRGANINLNHRDYYTVVIPPPAADPPAQPDPEKEK
jgi:hypothetical protein